jgi:hypothetical protein
MEVEMLYAMFIDLLMGLFNFFLLKSMIYTGNDVIIEKSHFFNMGSTTINISITTCLFKAIFWD